MVEKYRKHIYCQKEFLEDCVSRLNDESREAQSALYFWNDIKNILLSNNIKLYLDFEKEEFFDIKKDIEKRRLNAAKKGRNLQLLPMENFILELSIQQQIGNLHIHFTKINTKDQSWLTESLGKQNAIFFLNEDSSYTQKLQSDYGVIVIGKQDYKTLKDLLIDRSFAIHRGDNTNWFNLLSNNYTSGNSLILVDNYLLSDTNLYEENIKKIFDALLPTNLPSRIPFQILIVTTLRQNKCADLDCKSIYERIKNMVSDIRQDQEFEISILKNSGEVFHDRTIITNYSYVSCGAGFVIFKGGKSKKTTTISDYNVYLNPYSKWLSDAYSNLLNDLYEVYSTAPEYTMYSMPHFLIGKRGNRIIDEYKNFI